MSSSAKKFSRMRYLLLVALVTVFWLPAAGYAKNPDWLGPFFERTSEMIRKHFPSATLTSGEGTFSFTLNADDPSPTSSHAPNGIERIPRRGGVFGRIELRRGHYRGKESLPLRTESAGVTQFIAAPYSPKCDCHLFVHLYLPENESAEFAEDFQILLNNFGETIQ